MNLSEQRNQLMLSWIKLKHPEGDSYGLYYDEFDNPHVTLEIMGRTHSEYTIEDILKT